MVIIDASLSSIPHFNDFTYAKDAAGIFINLGHLNGPILVKIKLPLKKNEPNLDSSSYWEFSLAVNIEQKISVFTEFLEFFYKSKRIINIDSKKLSYSNNDGHFFFELSLAHELRHVVDQFYCLNKPTEDMCNLKLTI